MNIKNLATTLAVTGSLLLAGCSDSGDGTSGSRVSGTVTSVGENSVTVANVDFDTTGTEIDSDGDTDDIYPGMHVYVDGSVDGDTGVAHKITYDSEIEGVVMAHDSVAGTMTVMGQAVSYNVDTIVFDDDNMMDPMQSFDPATIVPGNVVEVSGNLVNGVVEATRIEYEGAALGTDEDVEIKGYISNYDEINGTFSIGGCEVTISETNPTTEIEDNVVLAENALVEVKSSQELLTIDLNAQPQTCAMVAVEVEGEDDEDDYDDIDDDHGDDYVS